MTIWFRCIVVTILLLLISLPAWAQGVHSDLGGAAPLSDVSGAATQSDQALLQSDETQIRMNDIAAALASALREGTLGASVVGGAEPMAVSPGLADLFLAPSRSETQEASETFVAALTAEGIPAEQARGLAAAMAGLLEDETVDLPQLRPSLAAFNAVIDAAPTPALAAPPVEITAARAVLTALLDGAE